MKHFLHLSTNTDLDGHCRFCMEGQGNLASLVNHLVSQHAYQVVHVGAEWGEDREGKTIHHTVFVLGTVNPAPPDPPAARFEIRVLGEHEG